MSRALALPLLSGALLAAGAPPALSPLAPFVALVPLAVWLIALPTGARGALTAAAGGLVAGAVQHGWGLRWLPATLGAVAGQLVGWAAYVGVVAALAALTAVAVCALHRTVRARALPVWVALPLGWTALEWALAHLPLGLAFPWAPLGLGLARWPAAVGIAELGGPGGLTAWLAAVNGAVAHALLRARAAARGGVLPAAAAALLVAALPLGWGRARTRALDAPAVGTMAAVALAVPPALPDAERTARGIEDLRRVLADVRPGVARLVVLPEMMAPVDLASAGGAAARAALESEAARLRAPLLVGTLGVEGGRAYNSALVVGGPPGAPPLRADKRRLVPGAERATRLRPPWLAPAASGYATGDGGRVLDVDGLAVGPLVCFDVAFAGDARLLVRRGARALAAVTSDAWFGSGAARSAGIAQQRAHLTMRVVETRTGAVRASNGGPALLVEPTGAVGLETGPGALAGEVRSAARATLFVRTGDLAGPGAAMALLALLLWPVAGRRGTPGGRHGFS